MADAPEYDVIAGLRREVASADAAILRLEDRRLSLEEELEELARDLAFYQAKSVKTTAAITALEAVNG